MSEYWVSHKRYHCKYCNIYIADDKPSRTQHENGLRHKGNVERFVRGLYKEGEKRVREREEEKTIMIGVKKAAETAYALDVASGRASSSHSLSSSRSAPPPSTRVKPVNPFANYTTAAQLGITDPDVEEAERRMGMGIPGQWTLSNSAEAKPPVDETATSSENAGGRKRLVFPAALDAEDGDVRAFKLRKKVVGPGVGGTYDPVAIPIKLKSKKEKEEGEVKVEVADKISLERASGTSESTTSNPSKDGSKWTKVQWQKAYVDDVETPKAEPDAGPESTSTLEFDELPRPSACSASDVASDAVDSVKPDPDTEPSSSSLLEPPQTSTAGLFRKRRPRRA
ncbi:hypothetical protein EDD16DRAFT_1714810 [Pisolithus croceorrhizus]|nr:hypothetical protein EDD16DRAFT_1714810 [Pisolithus croceorrhizus]